MNSSPPPKEKPLEELAQAAKAEDTKAAKNKKGRRQSLIELAQKAKAKDAKVEADESKDSVKDALEES